VAKSSQKAAKGKPITSHPLFPALVALWFGALFGLGSLAIRPALIEALVLRSGIATYIPAAAPPLGMTARGLIALSLALLGAMIGGALALRLKRTKPELDRAVRRPISAHDELGEGLGEVAAQADKLALPIAPAMPGPDDLPEQHWSAPAISVAVPEDEPVSTPERPAARPATGFGARPDQAASQPSDVAAADTQAASPAEAVLPRPADLGLVELALRLQDAMARRRSARQANLAEVAISHSGNDEESIEAEAGSVAEDAFGSLLGIAGPLARTARERPVDSAATATDGPTTPLAAGDAEAALRAALANLQRTRSAA
jgi:hypothetical protein